MVGCRTALLSVLVLVSGADASCLDNPINASDRKNLSTGDESYPIGLFPGNWDASVITTSVVQILLEERVGYNAQDMGRGVNTIAGYNGLLGCLSPNNLSHPDCGQTTITYRHIQMEAWSEGYANEWKEIQAQYASMAPVALGSMGYDGVSSYFIPRDIANAAYNQDGVTLDYYKSWNASWANPTKYFDSLASVNRSHLVPCSQTVFTNKVLMKDVLRITGDSAGFLEAADGSVTAKCSDDYFFLPPPCRANSSLCVPYFTADPGWGLDDVMQKVISFNMPIAIGVAKAWWALAVEVKSAFYWWTPDTTFLSLDPVEITFPPYDFNAYQSGDKRTRPDGTAITKIVSQDLRSLAPPAEDLVRNVRFSLANVMDMMKDMNAQGDSYLDAACRWLRANTDTWQSWLPDSTKCFPGFGLFDTNNEEFVDNRQDPTFLECRACPSGTYSARLDDNAGITYECKPCEPGTSQLVGAALQCEPCGLGEYQNNSGSQSCNRCGIGEYQDQKGSVRCAQCPRGGVTLGFGSVTLGDCGCSAGFLNVGGDIQNLTCVECGEGMDCPSLATLDSLKSGQSALGAQFVARIHENFYSSPQEPLSLFRCNEPGRCPGGTPGSCSGGTEGSACTDCPEGTTWDQPECRQCTAWQQFGWILAIVMVLSGLVMAYYLLTSQSTAKASVLFTTTCAFGMTVSALQSVGIIGMMTVDFPLQLKGIYEFLQIFVLDIDSFAFSCVAGGYAPVRYIVSVLFFPVLVLWLLGWQQLSKLFPARHRWEDAKTKSTIGAILQVSFSTMSTIALAPMMCFSHPNGVHSVLKYPGVTCGDEDHTIMLVFGLLLLAFGVLGFLALCTYAVIVVPRWSSTGQHAKVKAFRFLLFRFRLDSWWFGVLLLARGPLMSLPIAFATDYPPVQVMCVILVFLVFLIVEAHTWPWKVPLLNVMDCFIGFCITMLITSNSLHLGQLQGSMRDFANGMSSVIMGMVGVSMFLLVAMTASAIVFRSALGGQQELLMFNLGRVPKPSDMAHSLMSVAGELTQMEEESVAKALGAMAVYDVKLMMAYMSLLGTEILNDGESGRFKSRINSSSFGPGAKASAKPKVSTSQDEPKEQKEAEPTESNAVVEASPQKEDVPDVNEDATKAKETDLGMVLEKEPVLSALI